MLFCLFEPSKKSREDAVTGPEREVLEAFNNLPAPQKKMAREVILALARVVLG